VGRKAGIRESQLMALADFENSAEFTSAEKLVLRYAVAMTRTPLVIPSGLFEDLERIFDRRQLVELTSAIAWENYRARFNHALEIEAEGFYQGALCLLEPRVTASSALDGPSAKE
jgi:alkylhydroperoxidase family enzyme